MLNTILSVIWPIKEFVNFIFQKTLGDYITNNLNLTYIEDEIKKNYEIVLSDLELNSFEINKKHFGLSPIKLLEGKIKKLRIKYPKNNEKIEIMIEDLYITLMPIQNSEKITKRKIKAKSVFEKQQNKENSIVANMLNKALHNLEIVIKNTCVKICTYEIENNTRNNPTFTVLIGKIGYSKYKENNYNKLFLFNKKIQLDDFCVKVSHNINNDEVNYFNTINEEKLSRMSDFERRKERKERLFLINSDHSTILTVNKVENDEYCSLLLKFIEESPDNLKIQMDISNFEVILNSLQIHFITNFIEVCKIIFIKMKKKPDNENNISNTSHSDTSQQDIPFLELLGFKLNNIIPCFNLNLLNVVLCQNKKNDYPRLWTFLDYKYSEKLDNFDKIESHFMYFEDSFFILNIKNIFANSVKSLVESNRSTEIGLGEVRFNYNVYKGKKLKSPVNPTKINESKCTDNSAYSSVYESLCRFDNMASSLKLRKTELGNKDNIFMSMCESKEFYQKNYQTLLNYDFIFDSIEFIRLNSIKNVDSSLFETMANNDYTISIKVLNKIIKNDKLSKERTLISLFLPDIHINFHPVLITYIINLLFNNILLVNEVLYNDVSQSVLSKVFCRDDILNIEKELFNPENKENTDKSDNNEFEDDFMNSTIVLPNKSENLEKIISSKSKLFIYLNKLTVNVYNFKKDDIDEHYKNLFNLYIQPVASNLWLNKKIDFSETPYSYFNNTNYICFSINETEIFLKSKDLKNKVDFTCSLNIKSFLVGFKKKNLIFPLIDYTNTNYSNTNYFGSPKEKSINPSKKYITENADIKKNQLFDSQNMVLFDIEKFEKKFKNQCENKFKKWCIILKTKSFVKNDIMNEMKQYYSSHKIKNLTFDYDENIKCNSLDKTKVYISLMHINLFYQNYFFNDFIDFIDLFTYSLNLSEIFTNSIKKINKQLKIKALKIFNLTSVDQFLIKQNTRNVLEVDISIKSIQLTFLKEIFIKDLNDLYKDKDLIYKLINSSFLRVSLHNLISLILFNKQDYKEILLSIENAKVVLKKKEYKKDNSLKALDEESFNYLLYKGTQDEMINIITAVVRIKDKPDIKSKTDFISKFFNQDLNQKQLLMYSNYDDFLSKSLIFMNDRDVNIFVTLNQVVVSLFYEQFDINYFVELKKELIQIENENDRLFDKTIDFKKQDLSLPNKVSTIIQFECSKLVIDSFIDYKKDIFIPPTELKNKMRMIVIMESVKYDETLESSQKYFLLSMNNMNVMFLKNLDFDNANHILDNLESTLIIENSFLQRIGFTEIMYVLGLSVCFRNLSSQKIQLDFKLDNLEVNFCSDSLKSFRVFVINVLNEIKLIRKLLGLDKKDSDIIIDETEIIKNKSFSIEVESNNQLDSILKSGYFCENSNKNEEFLDEIEFDCEENMKEDINLKKYKNLTYTFTVNCIKISLFDGKDFSFVSKDNNSNSDINKSEFKIKKVSQSKFEIIDDYISAKKSLKIGDYSRRRSVKRNYENQINIIIHNSDLQLYFDNLSNKPFSITLEIVKAEIDDLIKNSKYRKMFSKYNYDCKTPVLKLKFDVLNYSDLNKLFVFQDRKNFDISLNFQLEPIKIQVDQNSLLFLLQVFKVNFNLSKETNSIIDEELELENEINKRLFESKIEDSKVSGNVQISVIKVFMKQFFINISYNSHKLSLNQINKNYLELLNFSNIKDLKIVFNEYSNSKSLDFYEFIHDLFIFWRDDIKKNQIVSAVFSSISYFRPFKNMVSGLIDLIKQPYLAIKDNKNIKKGVVQGLANFFISFSSESIFLSEKFLNLFSGIVGKEKKNRKSVYKNYLHLVNEKVRKDDKYFLK